MPIAECVWAYFLSGLSETFNILTLYCKFAFARSNVFEIIRKPSNTNSPGWLGLISREHNCSSNGKGISLNWVSRVIGDYFRLFDIGFWFRWLLRILAGIPHPVKVSNPKILAKKWQNFWKFRKMMVMRSHFIYMEGWSWAVIKNPVLMTVYDHHFLWL